MGVFSCDHMTTTGIGTDYWVSEGQITTSLLTGTPPNLPFLVEKVVAY